jgi:hypothetical protein
MHFVITITYFLLFEIIEFLILILFLIFQVINQTLYD